VGRDLQWFNDDAAAIVLLASLFSLSILFIVQQSSIVVRFF
jgi:hypothetical protein